MTPSRWLAEHLTEVLVAVAQAQAALAGKEQTSAPQAGLDDA